MPPLIALHAHPRHPLPRHRSGGTRGAGPSWIHLLSVWTLISPALAVWFIRRGNVRTHKGFMVGTFLGLAGAGLGALVPGRALSRLFF